MSRFASPPSSRPAGLPMYALPELRAANDALWGALATALRDQGVEGVPASLDHEASTEALWGAPDLLFAQICSLPLRRLYRGRLRVLGVPHYDLPGCEGPLHRAFVVVSASSPVRSLAELVGARVAINERGSNTGFALFVARAASDGQGESFFAGCQETGAHVESLTRVAEGRADVASIDCVTHALLARHRPELVAATRVLTTTAPSPSPPLVTSSSTDERVERQLREAFADLLVDPALEGARAALGLAGFSWFEARGDLAEATERWLADLIAGPRAVD